MSLLQIVEPTLFPESSWSNLAKIVYRRTYSRNDFGKQESWKETVDRVVRGNLGTVDPKFLLSNEGEILERFMTSRKMTPAGRGLWFSGAPAHSKIGGAALVNCWGFTADDWYNFVICFDYLMTGGGTGMSVENRFVSKLPKIKKDVVITHLDTKDADFIVPDSREGWCELIRKVLEAFFVTGKGFSYSTVCLRGYGEAIRGFGGKASGPLPLIECVNRLSQILNARAGKHVRPIDAADVLCTLGACVVAGNVRRSAIIILGDSFDKDYLKAKRWDLGPIPSERAMANFSIVIDDPDDFHPLFWKTYECGEPFGIVNRKNIRTFARMGELKKDTAEIVNPCGEANLEDGEPCNLQELFLHNLRDIEEAAWAARLAHRYGKRVTMERYHQPKSQEVVNRNRRIGTGITGCLMSPLFEAKSLDTIYDAIQQENVAYSKQLGIPESIRTTVVKPSGTMSLVGDCTPGIHPAYSRHFIRRVRLAANDSLVPILDRAGHHMEPVKKFDGSLDHGTLVADFYCQTPDNVPCADEGFDTWKQLDALLLAQRHWSDQAVSVTVYYRREELPRLKEWIINHLNEIKTVSFLCHNDHGFEQAPLEAISKSQYEKMSQSVIPISFDEIMGGDLESQECAGGVCPVK